VSVNPALQPLTGLTVIDLSEGIAGPYCTKLLADFGARVIKVERPGGDVARRWGPFPTGDANPEASGTFLHLNTNKHGIVVDWLRPEGARIVRDLACSADVLVDACRPGMLAEAGLGVGRLLAETPRLVVCSITGFGQSGPYCDYEMTEIVAFAMGGPMNASGIPDREPVKLVGNVVQAHAGANACAAILAAAYHAGRTGVGQHLDVAVFETQNGSLDRRRYYNLAYQYSSTVTLRQATVGLARPAPGGRFLAHDGRWVTTGRIWPDHVERMGKILGLRLDASILSEQGDAARAEVNAAIAAWVAERDSRQAMRDAQAQGWPVVVVNDPLSLLDDDHLVARNYWRRAGHPVAGDLPYCGPPWRTQGSGWVLRRTAPTLGQDTDRILREDAGCRASDIAALRRLGVVA